MSIVPITASTPACYGICCPKHSQCARYEAVETTSMDATIATCQGGDGERTMFVQVKHEEAEEC